MMIRMSDQRVSTNMVDYYQQRAPYYDAFYEAPERQADLERLRALIPPLFTDREVLEVAAGTGHWTELISATANRVCATDYNTAPLELAAQRNYPKGNVEFHQTDAFALSEIPGNFTGAFAGFWWSHMLLNSIDGFLEQLCSRLRPGSPVAFVDNRYVEGNSSPIIRADADGNTYQHRKLRDGRVHEVLKNFPHREDLLQAVGPYGVETSVVELNYFWMVTFKAR